MLSALPPPPPPCAVAGSVNQTNEQQLSPPTAPQRALPVEVLVGGVAVRPDPMIFTSSVPYKPDPSLYNISADRDIDDGWITCRSPPGQGKNVSVVVRHQGADDTSAPMFFDFLPPTQVLFQQADNSLTPRWTTGRIGQVWVCVPWVGTKVHVWFVHGACGCGRGGTLCAFPLLSLVPWGSCC
jgi:hypothetical protein